MRPAEWDELWRFATVVTAKYVIYRRFCVMDLLKLRTSGTFCSIHPYKVAARAGWSGFGA